MRKKIHAPKKNYSEKRKKSENSPVQNLSIIDEPFTLRNVYAALPTPVKSEHDFRHYKVIRLQNGLIALLVSDLRVSETIKQPSSDSSANEDSSSTDSESTSDTGASVSSGEKNEKKNNIKNITKIESFKKPKIFSPADENTDELAAAAMCVRVGSFSDPDELPGIAHLMEHLIFMGSSKYPDENEFDSFIASNGGRNNAATETEKTFFYFEIQQGVLPEALDRLANMISEPLFSASSITKELQSVDSEFVQVIQDDIARKEQLISLLGKKNHPIRKFLWGNMLSLRERPAKSVSLQKELSKFHKDHYCPENMTLTVEAAMSIDKLEALVVQSFKNIPQGKNATSKKSPLPPGFPFDSKCYCSILKAIPIQQINNLEIMWAFPSIKTFYKTKPEYYLSTLIGDEGHGSLLSYLRHKLWALDLSCGNHDGGIYNTSTYCLFQLSLNLTEAGYFHLFDVLTAVFQYIKMIQKMGPVKRVFDEIKTIENNIFKWQEQINTGNYVEHLCNNMQDFKPEDYITGPQLLHEYKPKLIKEFLDLLSPENATIILFSKHHEDENICDKKEFWFQIPYCIYNISPQWIQTWNNLTLNPTFHLPFENKFIAKNFTIKTSELPQTPYPVKILDTAQSRLWYKKDFKFLVPKAYVYFHLITPLVNQTPQNSVLFDVFKLILEYNLNEDTFNALSADLLFHIMSLETGMVIYLRGFNDKLFLLFEIIVKHLVNFDVSEETFNVLKRRVMQNYHNMFIKPDKLAKELQFSIIEQTFWTSVDKRSLLTTVTKDMLTSFVNHLKTCLFIEGLIQGNVTVEEAMMYERTLCEKLKCKLLPKAAFPEIRIYKLPDKSKICKVRNFIKNDSNSVIINYYQYGPGDIFSTCVMDLLVSFMQEPCFNYLRTQQQLGYHVECCCSNVSGIIGFTIMIRTQAHKYNTSYIDEKIETFLDNFSENLKLVKKSRYDEVIDILLNTKQSDDVELEDEVYGNWNEIFTQNYLFDRLNMEVQYLKKITLSHLKKFFKKLRPDLNQFKKLSIQVIGDGKQEHVPKNCSLKKGKCNYIKKNEDKLSIATLSGYLNHTRDIRINQIEKQQKEVFEYEINPLAEEDKQVFIADTNIFKQNLMLYPITRLLH